MAVTRSWQTDVVEQAAPVKAGPKRGGGFLWLLGASILVAGALALVFIAKTQSFVLEQGQLDRGELLNLNQMKTPADMLPFLLVFQNSDEREAAAYKTFEYVQAHRPLQNTGALARIRSGRFFLRSLAFLSDITSHERTPQPFYSRVE